MAFYRVRVNLSIAFFPFLASLWGRSIIVNTYDQTYDTTNPLASEKDKGKPQIYYLHNIMPIPQGFQSIGYKQRIAPFAPGPVTNFDKAFQLQNSNLNRFLLVPAGGLNYIYDPGVGTWISCPFPASSGVTTSTVVSTAFIDGQTYICYANYGIFIYDEVNKVLAPQTITGLDLSNIICITASNGYMLAFTQTAIAWSNQTNPLDFVPNLATGAGGGPIQNIKGPVIFAAEISNGFLVYCQRNIVAASYQANDNFPFMFAEVPGSSGIESPEDVGWQYNNGTHYAWTNAGLLQINLTAAQIVFPEAADFLSANIYEDFSDTTNQFSVQYLTTPLQVRIAFIGERYVVISYGLIGLNFTYALVYDTGLNRWGKLKINHVHCFQWDTPPPYTFVTYGSLKNTTYGQLSNKTYGELIVTPSEVDTSDRQTLGFLQQDGTVQIVDFDLSEAPANGTMLLGKFQLMRNRYMVHNTTDMETINESITNFKFSIIPTLDGKTLLPPVPGVLLAEGQYSRKYGKRVAGQNLSLLFQGGFSMGAVILEFTQQGFR